jgi:hypothetical protein
MVTRHIVTASLKLELLAAALRLPLNKIWILMNFVFNFIDRLYTGSYILLATMSRCPPVPSSTRRMGIQKGSTCRSWTELDHSKYSTKSPRPTYRSFFFFTRELAYAQKSPRRLGMSTNLISMTVRKCWFIYTQGYPGCVHYRNIVHRLKWLDLALLHHIKDVRGTRISTSKQGLSRVVS